MTSNELYDSFCIEFPLETLDTMSLEKYTNLNKKDSFCYWLETITSTLGSIWGGSSYKFGIYKYNVSPKRNDNNYIHDEEYAWLAKYGRNKDEAFEKIKSIIGQIANAANNGDFQVIDSLDLGDAFKWKIAFLYSNKSLVSIFNPEMLRIAAEAKGLNDVKSKKVSEVQQFLLGLKGDTDIFEYSGKLWETAELIMKDRQNTWVYAPGDGACFWDDFYNEGVMAIGWDDLEDLSQYKNQNEINNKLQSLYEINTSKSNDAKACFDFCKNIKIGDSIIVKKGLYEILGYGIVESEYFYEDSVDEFKNRRKVSWEHNGIWTSPVSLPLKTLTKKDEKFRNTIMDIITGNNETIFIKDLLLSKKQIILQGAPGTGKTYIAKNIAEQLIFEEVSSDKKIQAERLKASEQFKLVQFHPSYTYEDFVRGIEVKTNNGQPEYTTTNKIIGEFAELAYKNWQDSQKSAEEVSKEEWMTEQFDNFADFVNEEAVSALENDYQLTDSVYIIAVEDDAFRYTSKNWKHGSNRMLFKDIKQAYLDDNKTRQDIRRNNNLSGLAQQDASYYIRVLENFREYLESEKIIYSPSHKSRVELENYVLIIDEINRANLPAVLGELIYALEYRGEKVESMYAVDGDNGLILPPNLYIIGTMNTADRSVGQIDYAVRRRFAFVDILPKVLADEPGFDVELFKKVSAFFIENVEDYINAPDNTILKKSEWLSDEFSPEDVWIGHSYFIMKENNRDIRLKYEVKPILREYLKDGILKESVNGQDIKTAINTL